MYAPPLTAPGEFDLVYDSTGYGGMRRYNPRGMAIFATTAARAEAKLELEALGFYYLVTYRDVNGYGLSWCYRPSWPQFTIRPSRRDRLPSFQHPDWSPKISLYRNPAYDLMHDPDPRYS